MATPEDNFYNYVNHLIYTENATLLGAIRTYLLDNNIPVQYKHMNCIHTTVNTIANRYINEMNIYNNINNNNININNINYNLTNETILLLTLLQEVQNLMLYNNIIH